MAVPEETRQIEVEFTHSRRTQADECPEPKQAERPLAGVLED